MGKKYFLTVVPPNSTDFLLLNPCPAPSINSVYYPQTKAQHCGLQTEVSRQRSGLSDSCLLAHRSVRCKTQVHKNNLYLLPHVATVRMNLPFRNKFQKQCLGTGRDCGTFSCGTYSAVVFSVYAIYSSQKLRKTAFENIRME